MQCRQQHSFPPAHLPLPSSDGCATLAELAIVGPCPGLKSRPIEVTETFCHPQQHHQRCLLHLELPLATFPEPWFPMLTFEISEIKFLTWFFPKVIHLDCCKFLQPNRVGKMAVPFVSLLTAWCWEGQTRHHPVPSQVQAIPTSPAELLKLCSTLTISFMALGTANSQICSTMKIKLNLIAN